MKNKLLVICGPTATGKTALAVKLAKKFSSRGRPASGWSAELISADSRQVYQGMDIITGKDHPAGVKVWLLDMVRPNYRFSVADYVAIAKPIIEDIWQRGKLPILVGGTGFYIKALLNSVETINIKPDWKLRQRLEKWPVEKLARHLKELAPKKWQKMNKSDRQNPRRLIRAIEIACNLKTKNSQPKASTIGRSAFGRGRPLAEKFKSPQSGISAKCENLLMVGLKAPLKVLDQRIDERVEARVKQGAIKEVKKLLTDGYNWENSVLGETIGYKEWRKYFESLKKCESLKKEAIKRWQTTEHQYARRQMTWFKKTLRQAQGKWFDITNDDWEKKMVKLIKQWYGNIK